MKIFFTADIHWIGSWKSKSLFSLRDQWTKANADLLVVAGDLAVAYEARETCKLLRKIAGDKPIVVTLGNHDYWTGERFLRKGVNLEEVEDHYWIPAFKEFDIHFLDRGNYSLSGKMEIVGCYGHYDLGFAIPELQIEADMVSESNYLEGRHPSFPKEVYWNDCLYMPCKRGLFAEAYRQAVIIKKHLQNTGNKRIILVTHTVPFLELRDFSENQDLVSQFCRAYLGSKAIAKEIAPYTSQIDLLVCGHSGPRVGPVSVHGMTGINIGSEYGKPLSYIHDPSQKIKMIAK